MFIYKFGCVDLDALKRVTTEERITLFHIQVGACVWMWVEVGVVRD